VTSGQQDSSPAPYVVEKTIEEILAEAAAEDAERTLSALDSPSVGYEQSARSEPYTLSLNDAVVADAERAKEPAESIEVPLRPAKARPVDMSGSTAPGRTAEGSVRRAEAPAERGEAPGNRPEGRPKRAEAPARRGEALAARSGSPAIKTAAPEPQAVLARHAAEAAARAAQPPEIQHQADLQAALPEDDKPASDATDVDIGIEQMVREALVPVLKEYLDENLKPIIERIVREETRKILLGRKAK
jgi:hypothetical protein